MADEAALSNVPFPDAGGPAGQAPPAAPAAAATPPETPAAAATPTPAAPAAAAPPPASDWTSVRDAAKQYGLDELAALGDDHAAMQQLFMSHRRASESAPLARLGEEVLPHYEAFQKWRAEQAKAAP